MIYEARINGVKFHYSGQDKVEVLEKVYNDFVIDEKTTIEIIARPDETFETVEDDE